MDKNYNFDVAKKYKKHKTHLTIFTISIKSATNDGKSVTNKKLNSQEVRNKM